MSDAQRLLLLRVARPDRLDERAQGQLDQGKGEHHRNGDVQRRDRQVLEVAGGDEQLHEQPLERDEPDRDGRPERREAVPGRSVIAVAERHPGDAGPCLPDRQRHQAVKDHRDPEPQTLHGIRPLELPGPLQKAHREGRDAEDQPDAPGQEPRGAVVGGAQPQVRAHRRQHEPSGHHREPGPANRPDQASDREAVRGNGAVGDRVDHVRGGHEDDQPHALQRESSGDDSDLSPQASRRQAVEPRFGSARQPAGAQGRGEPGEETQNRRAGEAPRANVAPLGPKPHKGRRSRRGEPRCGLEGRHPAATERHRPVAEEGTECAILGAGEHRLALGDPPVELPEQKLARLCIAQTRQHVAYRLPGERLGHHRRLGRARVLARDAGRFGSLSGRRAKDEQPRGNQHQNHATPYRRSSNHSLSPSGPRLIRTGSTAAKHNASTGDVGNVAPGEPGRNPMPETGPIDLHGLRFPVLAVVPEEFHNNVTTNPSR